MPYLCILNIIWNQHPRICLILKFAAKIKILKLGTKKTWVEYF